MNIEVSIIIPVYNGESYLYDCLNSILTQLPIGWEVIVCDNMSTDKSIEIVRSFNHSALKVIEVTTRGVTYARQKGIENACGQYLFFVDCDDLIPNGVLPKMNSLIEKNYDIIIGDFVEDYGNSIVEKGYGFKAIKCGKELFKWIVLNKMGFLWGKLIKKSLFGDITIPYNLKFCEDYVLMLQLAQRARGVFHCGAITYNYLQHESSFCHKRKGVHEYANMFSSLAIFLSILLKHNEYEEGEQILIKSLFVYYLRLYLCVEGRWLNVKEYKAVFRAYLNEIKTQGLLSKWQCIQSEIVLICPWIITILYRPLLKYKYKRI